MRLKLLFTVIVITFCSIVSSNSFAAEEAYETIIYKSKGLVLRPTSSSSSSLSEWCTAPATKARTTHAVAVLYNVPHKQRLSLLGESYEAFVQNTVIPAIKKACGSSVSISLVDIAMKHSGFNPSISAYDMNHAPTWDVFKFRIDETGVFRTVYSPSVARVHMTQAQIDALTPKHVLESSRAYKNASKARDATLKKKKFLLLNSCKEKAKGKGAYCKFGWYMNAIYNNDIEKIRKFDQSEALPRAAKKSLLSHLANYYMRDLTCLSKDAVKKTIRYKTDTYDTYQGGVYAGQDGGDIYSGSYIINPEFVPVCNRICNHFGGSINRDMGLGLWRKNYINIFNEIDKVKVENCNSPKRKQFERNLISMTILSHDHKSKWFNAELDFK